MVFSEEYIKNHFEDIKNFANVIENRLEDDITPESVLRDNKFILEMAQKYKVNYIYVDKKYDINVEL